MGLIESKLNKPYHYLLYSLSVRLGRGMSQFFITVFLMVPLLVLFVGIPDAGLSFVWAMRFTFLALFGIVVAAVIYMMIGLSAVWLEDADPLFWMTDKCIMILGGAYVPVALFSPLVRKAAEYSPFGATMFVAHAFNPDFSDKWLTLVIVQLVWIGLLVPAVIWQYRRANKKISIHGG